jgi:hypothetical protein
VSRKKQADSPPLSPRDHARVRAAFHEAGRFIAAKHFKVAQVSGLHPLPNGSRFAGKTVYEATTPFNEAVIGWAGAIMEIYFANQPDKWGVTRKTVWEMFVENQLSKGDSDLISRHADKRKTFAAAVKIIKSNFEQTKEVADTLCRFGFVANFP